MLNGLVAFGQFADLKHMDHTRPDLELHFNTIRSSLGRNTDTVVTKLLVPRSAVGRIIGFGGSNIRFLKHSTDCEVEVRDSPEGDVSQILISSRSHSSRLTSASMRKVCSAAVARVASKR